MSSSTQEQKIAELRRIAAEKYKNTPEDKKPRIRVCEDCMNPIHGHDVCTQSGLYHDYKTLATLGGKVIEQEKRMITSKELLEAINTTRVKWQAARVQKVKVDTTSINLFQSFGMRMHWKLMRYGIMYGKVISDTCIEVHCIYEPVQEGDDHTFTPLSDEKKDPNVAHADKIAELLGMRRVGLVCTHQARDPDSIVLSGKELLLIAKEQSRFGDHCCLITLSPNVETSNINAQVWQATEQCVSLFKLGIFSYSDDISKESIITCSMSLEVAHEESTESSRQCMIKEPSQEIDTRWMTGFVAVEPFDSPLIRNGFIRLSRPGEEPPTMDNLHIYFSDPKRNRLNFVQKIADFHVLLFFAATIFDIKHDMPTIVAAIVTQDNELVVEYENLVKEYIRSVRGVRE
eukprot:Tbor_TRINITY_DN4973_c0_g1::TRINITY_DN4973_c0_g1_i2::g.9935::m.9935/K14015/NPLOC4, NPL4; nuclear protein localization protein 4 homolog